MTLNEAKTEKSRVEADMLATIRGFEAATGLSVTNVDLLHSQPFGGGREAVVLHLRVEL